MRKYEQPDKDDTVATASVLPEDSAEPRDTHMPLTPANILFLFLLGGFAGTLVETVWCLLIEGRFAWRAGLMFVPFNPVYGGGILVLYFTLRSFGRKQKLRVFLASYVVGTAVEYFFSWLQEQVLGSVSWDYSGLPLNIGGRVCLFYSLGWGILGLFWALYVSPLLERLIVRVPVLVKRILVSVLLSFVVCGMIVSALAILSWRARSLELSTPFFAPLFDRLFPDPVMQWFYPNIWFR